MTGPVWPLKREMVYRNTYIFSSRNGFIQAHQAKIWYVACGYVGSEDFNGDVLAFLAIAAKPYSAEAAVAQFMDDMIATCITQTIAKMYGVISTCFVILEILTPSWIPAS